MCSKPKVRPAPPPIAAQTDMSMVKDNPNENAARKERRRLGFSSTRLDTDGVLNAASKQASGSFKKTLG